MNWTKEAFNNTYWFHEGCWVQRKKGLDWVGWDATSAEPVRVRIGQHYNESTGIGESCRWFPDNATNIAFNELDATLLLGRGRPDAFMYSAENSLSAISISTWDVFIASVQRACFLRDVHAVAGNVSDQRLFEPLLKTQLSLLPTGVEIFADKGYDSRAANRATARSYGLRDRILKRRTKNGRRLYLSIWDPPVHQHERMRGVFNTMRSFIIHGHPHFLFGAPMSHIMRRRRSSAYAVLIWCIENAGDDEEEIEESAINEYQDSQTSEYSGRWLLPVVPHPVVVWEVRLAREGHLLTNVPLKCDDNLVWHTPVFVIFNSRWCRREVVLKLARNPPCEDAYYTMVAPTKIDDDCLTPDGYFYKKGHTPSTIDTNIRRRRSRMWKRFSLSSNLAEMPSHMNVYPSSLSQSHTKQRQ